MPTPTTSPTNTTNTTLTPDLKPVSGDIVGTNSNDYFINPPPHSTVDALGGSDTILISVEPHESDYGITANGGAGNDTIIDGAVGGDVPSLITDRNTLNGGAGNDLLVNGGISDVLNGGPGADQIYAGATNHIYLDGLDTFHIIASYDGNNIANFPNLNNGVTDLHGATVNTKFDFSDVNGPAIFYAVDLRGGGFGGNPIVPPFVLDRSNFSFNSAGDLVISANATNGEGTYTNVLTGTPWHDDASFNAAIAKGTVII